MKTLRDSIKELILYQNNFKEPEITATDQILFLLQERVGECVGEEEMELSEMDWRTRDLELVKRGRNQKRQEILTNLNQLFK